MTEQAEITQDVTVEDVGPCRKKLTITIPAGAVDDQLDTSLEMVSSEAQIPGFRKGRVPKRLIEKKFGSMVRDEARNQLIASAYSRAVEEHELKVIGEPDQSELEGLEVKPGEDLTLSVEVEVAPEFDLPELDGLDVKRPTIEVTDERIDGQIERILLNEGELEPREEAEAGDYCIGHGVMKTGDGEEVLNLEGAVIQIPEDESKGMILGVIVDDFAKQVGLPKPGDAVTVEAVGPEHHEKEAVRGKPVSIAFDVEQVQRIIPASAEQMVAKLGLADESQFREMVSSRLNQRVMIEQQAAMRQQVAARLLGDVSFDLPENLTENQAARNLHRQRMEMLYRGVDPNVVEERLAELRAGSKEAAQRELKLFFILAKVAGDMQVQVTEEEINGRIMQIAAERGERPDALRTELVKSGQVQVLAQQVREHKTLDAILAKANVEDVTAKEYNDKVAGADGISPVGTE